MTIRVLHDFILVEEPVPTTKTVHGIVLVADKEATLKCPVIGVGPGTFDAAGKELGVGGIKVGDILHLPKEVISGAPKMTHEGKKYLFIKPPQVLAWEKV
ncbi:co-chaperonin GroES [compost metagenome]